MMEKCLRLLVVLATIFFASISLAGTYTVEFGDTLSGIAEKRCEKLASLKKLNPQIKNFNRIWPGQVINMPTDKEDIKDSWHSKLARINKPTQQASIVASSIIIKELLAIGVSDAGRINDWTFLSKKQPVYAATAEVKKVTLMKDLPLQYPNSPPFRYKIFSQKRSDP